METVWKKCSNCKKEIPYGADHYRCSVASCNHERTGLQFCSVSCWSAHLPIYRHREGNAWALEAKAPATGPTLIRIDPAAGTVPRAASSGSAPNADEVLIVVSKLKAFIKHHADMNTSADVMDALSDHLRKISLDAIQRARADGRKTVMARDFVKG